MGHVHAANALGLSSPNDLVFHGGPVMHSSNTYAIYWFPSGYLLNATYENTINRYFADVAAASGQTDNVYSAATQYYDAAGPISYSSSFAGSVVDTDPFPTSGCDDTYKGFSDSVCLTDQQLQSELQNVLTAHGWHGGLANMFFLMTPNGVGSCVDGTPATPNGECSTNIFCAYHNYFVDSSGENVIYANEPYEAPGAGCTDPAQGFPTDPNADTTINTISHEHNEAITDPLTNPSFYAWINPSGDENGDLCAYDFGPELGGTPGADAYNQVINGHHYDVQQEYSNDGSTCVQHYLGIPVNFGIPTVSGAAGEGQVLSASSSGTWSQSPTSYTYQWLRCSSTNYLTCFAFPGDTGATYRLTTGDVGKIFRLAVYAGNAAGSSFAAESAPTAAVVPLPAAASQPGVTGVPVVGKTLSTTNGAWNTTVSFAYQWQRCDASANNCAAIAGATASTYALTAADGGHTVNAVVSGTNAAGTTSATSPATGEVVSLPHATKAPRVSGKTKVGKRLTAAPGAWSGPPTTYRYAWLRCTARGSRCVPIKKATHATYRPTRHDAGHRLRLRVTAINAAGRTTTTSAASARVRR